MRRAVKNELVLAQCECLVNCLSSSNDHANANKFYIMRNKR